MSVADTNAAESAFWATHDRSPALPDWDDLDAYEKNAEWNKGDESRFAKHPRFEPVYCDPCSATVFLGPDDICEWCGTEYHSRSSLRHWAAAFGGIAFAGVALPYIASLI